MNVKKSKSLQISAVDKFRIGKEAKNLLKKCSTIRI